MSIFGLQKKCTIQTFWECVGFISRILSFFCSPGTTFLKGKGGNPHILKKSQLCTFFATQKLTQSPVLLKVFGFCTFFATQKLTQSQASENARIQQFFCQPIRSQQGWSFRCSLQAKRIQVILRRWSARYRLTYNPMYYTISTSHLRRENAIPIVYVFNTEEPKLCLPISCYHLRASSCTNAHRDSWITF